MRISLEEVRERLFTNYQPLYRPLHEYVFVCDTLHKMGVDFDDVSNHYTGDPLFKNFFSNARWK